MPLPSQSAPLPDQFRRPHLPATFQRLFAHYQLDATLLTIELTETALMVDPDQCRRMLRDLKALGLSLSIDDFGTGFSSLSSLRRYPIDELKTDRCAETHGLPSWSGIFVCQAALRRRHGIPHEAKGVIDAHMQIRTRLRVWVSHSQASGPRAYEPTLNGGCGERIFHFPIARASGATIHLYQRQSSQAPCGMAES